MWDLIVSVPDHCLSFYWSFEQTMMGPRPQCYIPSNKVIGPLILEKKIFEGFLPYMGMAATLIK